MSNAEIARTARDRAVHMASASTEKKNAALRIMAEKIRRHKSEILAANEADIDQARKANRPDHLLSRLRFGDRKIESRIRALERIEELPDPLPCDYAWSFKIRVLPASQ